MYIYIFLFLYATCVSFPNSSHNVWDTQLYLVVLHYYSTGTKSLKHCPSMTLPLGTKQAAWRHVIVRVENLIILRRALTPNPFKHLLDELKCWLHCRPINLHSHALKSSLKHFQKSGGYCRRKSETRSKIGCSKNSIDIEYVFVAQPFIPYSM